jgi:hypothetical protein
MHSRLPLVREIRAGLVVAGALFLGSRLAGQVEQAWAALYHGGGNDEPREIAVDVSGNVYVTGTSSPSGCNFGCADYATVKYGPDGSLLWVAGKNGSADGQDAATSLALDGEGNVYVTGAMEVQGRGRDAVTIKYDSKGKEVWTAPYDAGMWDVASKVMVHPLGHIYVESLAGESVDTFSTARRTQAGPATTSPRSSWTRTGTRSGPWSTTAKGTAPMAFPT